MTAIFQLFRAPALAVITSTMLATTGAAQTSVDTYWRPAETANAEINLSLGEMLMGLRGDVRQIITDIDSLDVQDDACKQDAARDGGSNDTRQRAFCEINLEAGKIDIFESTQTVLNANSRELYGLAAQFQSDKEDLVDAMVQVGDDISVASEQLDAIKQNASVLLGQLDIENLTMDDERTLREILRTAQLNQIDLDTLNLVSEELNILEGWASTQHKALQDWAFETEMAAADMEIDIAYASQRLGTVQTYAGTAAEREEMAAFPIIFSELGDLVDRLKGMKDTNGYEVDLAEASVLPTPESPPSDRRGLFLALQAIVGDQTSEMVSN